MDQICICHKEINLDKLNVIIRFSIHKRELYRIINIKEYQTKLADEIGVH